MEHRTSKLKFSIDSILRSPSRRVACSPWSSYDNCKSILSPLRAAFPYAGELTKAPASPVALCFPQPFYTMALAGTIAAGGFGTPATSSVYYSLQPVSASNPYNSDASNADNSDGNSDCSSDTASMDGAAISKGLSEVFLDEQQELSKSPVSTQNTKAVDKILAKKKQRTAFTRQQLQDLETRFSQQKYLTRRDRCALADKLGLTEKHVKTWYQNRRTKWKRDCTEVDWSTQREYAAKQMHTQYLDTCTRLHYTNQSPCVQASTCT